MISRIELENQLVNEIHYLPVDAMEKMLKWVRSLKKVTPVEQTMQLDNVVNFERDESISAGLALKNFLKKYENDPIDIDTSIFDDYRKTVTEREIDL
jgi:hypothetical protein